MRGKYKNDDTEIEGEIDISWGLFFVALGCGLLASSLTPGIAGPGYLAFGAVYLVVGIVNAIVKLRGKR